MIQPDAKALPPARRQDSSSLRGSGSNGAAGFFPGLSYLLSSGTGVPRGRSGWEVRARLVAGGRMVRNGEPNGASLDISTSGAISVEIEPPSRERGSSREADLEGRISG
jgi:hypothetical protein